MDPNSVRGGQRTAFSIVSDVLNKSKAAANIPIESNVRVENLDQLDIVTANDLFRKDSDSFFREKASYDDSVNIDSLFFKDSDSDSDEELDPDLVEEVSGESGTVSSEGEVSSNIVGEVSSNPETNYSNGEVVVDIGNVASSSTSGTEDMSVPSDFWYSGDSFSSIEVKESNSTNTKYWIPQVPEPYLPRKGMIFDEMEKAILFYFRYADRAGFNCRRSSVKYVEKGSKEVVHKYVICSRAGKAEGCNVDGLQAENGKLKRKYPSQMRECPAKIGIKVLDKTGRCYVHSFEQMHNHELFTKSTVHMSRARRQLDYFDKLLIWQLYKSNLGAVKAHGIVTAFKGGIQNQGAKKVDYKNFTRDLNCYTKDTDANDLFNMLEKRAENVKGFSFYHLLEKEELRGLFWADPIAKRNYKEFSDVVSFDATYRTNKYNMIFVPFTGIDNHQRCVTFGAALIAQETEEYYIWLLESFLNAFGNQPSIVVTDQDRAMRNAIEKVFTRSRHRLCMWHIGKKLTVKVSSKVIKETDFRKRMNNLIWNSCLDPHVFEVKWNSLVAEHGLNDNKWLKKMYSLRSTWIPAYFKDMPLSGLMRTTSRSESENYFFQSFLSNTTNLIMFMVKFDAAMDKQRLIQSESDYNSMNKLPPIHSLLEFEVQGSRFYTHKIFSLFQKEINDCVWTCSVVNCNSMVGKEMFTVFEQTSSNKNIPNKSVFFNANSSNFRSVNRNQFQYEVVFSAENDSFNCDCMVFEHFGFLCRHVLCVMKSKFRVEIPTKYLLRRWQKGVISSHELEKCYFAGEDVGGCHALVNEAYRVVADCINMVGHDPESILKFIEWQKEIRFKIEQNPPKGDTRTKSDRISSMLGIKKVDKVTIRNPEGVKFKGSGSGAKRMQGEREVAMKKNAKKKDPKKKDFRSCGYCKAQVAPGEKHDWRTCQVRIGDERKAAELKEAQRRAAEGEAVDMDI